MNNSIRNISIGNYSQISSCDFKDYGIKLYLQKNNKVSNLSREKILSLCKCNFKILIVDDSDFNLTVLK